MDLDFDCGYEDFQDDLFDGRSYSGFESQPETLVVSDSVLTELTAGTRGDAAMLSVEKYSELTDEEAKTLSENDHFPEAILEVLSTSRSTGELVYICNALSTVSHPQRGIARPLHQVLVMYPELGSFVGRALMNAIDPSNCTSEDLSEIVDMLEVKGAGRRLVADTLLKVLEAPRHTKTHKPDNGWGVKLLEMVEEEYVERSNHILCLRLICGTVITASDTRKKADAGTERLQEKLNKGLYKAIVDDFLNCPLQSAGMYCMAVACILYQRHEYQIHMIEYFVQRGGLQRAELIGQNAQSTKQLIWVFILLRAVTRNGELVEKQYEWDTIYGALKQLYPSACKELQTLMYWVSAVVNSCTARQLISDYPDLPREVITLSKRGSHSSDAAVRHLCTTTASLATLIPNEVGELMMGEMEKLFDRFCRPVHPATPSKLNIAFEICKCYALVANQSAKYTPEMVRSLHSWSDILKDSLELYIRTSDRNPRVLRQVNRVMINCTAMAEYKESLLTPEWAVLINELAQLESTSRAEGCCLMSNLKLR